MSQLVIFVVPFYKPGTGQFLEAVMDLDGVQLAIITHDPDHHFPERIRRRVPIEQAASITSPEALLVSAQNLLRQFGRPHRILAINEQIQVPVARLREILGVDGMSVETITGFRDKGQMKKAFREAGVPCARYVAARTKQEAREFVAEVGFPVCVKPIDGAAAQATFKVPNPEVLEDILEASGLSFAQPIQIEEFIRGTEHSFETLSVGGRHLWHSLTHYHPTPLKVTRNPWIQWNIVMPRDIDVPEYDDIKAAGTKALTCLGMGTGLTHLEWFRREDGSVAVNEVAARPPGAEIVTLNNRVHDMDLFTIWAKMMVWEHLDPVPERKYAAGALFLRGLGGAVVKHVEGLEILNEFSDMVTDMQLPYPGQPAGNTYEGEGYILIRHPSTERVEEALSTITSQVRVRMY
jgi:formate-dependent phosphoribosylglycinamide formyltransferase (GAR transformylase)